MIRFAPEPFILLCGVKAFNVRRNEKAGRLTRLRVCGFPSHSDVELFNEVFGEFCGDAACYLVDTPFPLSRRQTVTSRAAVRVE